VFGPARQLHISSYNVSLLVIGSLSDGTVEYCGFVWWSVSTNDTKKSPLSHNQWWNQCDKQRSYKRSKLEGLGLLVIKDPITYLV